MKKSFAIILYTISLIHVAEAQGKLFIIGGGKRPPELLNRLVEVSGVKNEGYIVILPMASGEQDSSIYYAAKQFIDIGISRVVGVEMKKGELLSPTLLDSVAKARLIYIAGGDQSRFMDIVSGTALEQAVKTCYKNGNVIAGTSAGAAVMSEKMITGVELKYRNTTEATESRPGFTTIEADNIELRNGLGFLKNSIIDQHFIIRKRQNRLIAVAIENPKFLCVGIDEATAILVQKGKAEVVGDSQVFIIYNKGKASKDKKGKLGSAGMRLDVFVHGDMFKIS